MPKPQDHFTIVKTVIYFFVCIYVSSCITKHILSNVEQLYFGAFWL